MPSKRYISVDAPPPSLVPGWERWKFREGRGEKAREWRGERIREDSWSRDVPGPMQCCRSAQKSLCDITLHLEGVRNAARTLHIRTCHGYVVHGVRGKALPTPVGPRLRLGLIREYVFSCLSVPPSIFLSLSQLYTDPVLDNGHIIRISGDTKN